MAESGYFDAIIIGSGPAGISCALELHDSAANCLILERGNKIGFHLSTIPNSIKNFAGGFHENGESLREKMAALVEQVGCDYRLSQEITSVDLRNLKVTTNGTEVRGRTILIATGNRRRKLGVPNELTFGNDVIYDISHLDPQSLDGQSIVIAGGSDNATLDALELADRAEKIYLVHRSQTLTARPDIIKRIYENEKIEVLLSTQIVSLEGNQKLQRLMVRSATQEREIEASRLVVKIGEVPNTELFAGQVEMAATGHIVIDRSGATSVANVFAAGDITEPGYPRLATAVGLGIQAAWSIRRILEHR